MNQQQRAIQSDEKRNNAIADALDKRLAVMELAALSLLQEIKQTRKVTKRGKK